MYQPHESNPHFVRPSRPQEDQTSQSTIPLVPLPPQRETKRSKHRGSRGSQSRRPDEHVGPISIPPRRKDKHSEPPPKPQHSDEHVQPIPVPVQLKDQQSEPSPGSSAPHPQQQQGQYPGPYGSPVLQPQHHGRSARPHGLWQPRDQRTNFFTWFIAVFCAVFWIVIIIGGIVILIVYLVFRPRSPRFDVSTATLNAAYLDMGYMLNADLTVLANFTNPNKKMSVDFSYMTIQLYYGKTLIANQYIEPFSAAKAQTKFAYLRMITSQVRLPILEVRRLNRQMETNGVELEMKGFFRARSHLGGLLRYSYWLHGQCTIVVARPPDGTLIRSKCKTKH
ncbi:hypothetical protein FNV43_RR25902 [Rhamnella rubrinervis]|uniref:Late embryogenesis abundant protein LEA-2 subgroup domain-containing protein n=1 Tax=Rhamnella rubrinervis TaxID=2594499 RepID=A0A8K0GJ50_9ROSA|nr:hypothetical protein FNV43_RR25902 [Rhamnella rubrinervis]